METVADVRIRTVISESEDPILHFFFAKIPSRDRAKVLKRIIRHVPLSAFGLGVDELPAHLCAMYRMSYATVSVSADATTAPQISKQTRANSKVEVTDRAQSIASDQTDEPSGFGLPAFLQGTDELGIFGGAVT